MSSVAKPNISFDEFYSEIFLDRWPTLKQSLLREESKVRRSCFHDFAHYVMDQASIRAAEALHVLPGDQVLDLCAAPGGKTLVLLEKLQGKGLLIANEWSRDRRGRLTKVIEEHVPEEFKKNIQVTGYDGNQFGLKRPDTFDRVLLDSPCSSERHLLLEDPEMKDWKISRTKQLMQRQYSLLCSALLSLKPGGTLVYSTCSISNLENDGVIERLLKKKEGSVALDLDHPDFQDLERSKFGFQIFPDRAQGAGPIYFSRLKKCDQF